MIPSEMSKSGAVSAHGELTAPDDQNPHGQP